MKKDKYPTPTAGPVTPPLTLAQAREIELERREDQQTELGKQDVGPTPGPWAMSRDAVPAWHTQITVYTESDGERVATVFRTVHNASLIAAAPDLLAALQTVLFDLEIVIDHNRTPGNNRTTSDVLLVGMEHHRDAARAAISKAKGTQ